MKIRELFLHHAQTHAWPGGAPDVFADADVLSEATFLELAQVAWRGTWGLLFDLRTTAEFEGQDVGILVLGGVSALQWNDSDSQDRNRAWVVMGSSFSRTAGGLAIDFEFYKTGERLQVTAKKASFYSGNVPGLDEWQPDFGRPADEVSSGLPGWDSRIGSIQCLSTWTADS